MPPSHGSPVVPVSLVVPGPVLLAVAVAGPVVPGLVVLVPVAVSPLETVKPNVVCSELTGTGMGNQVSIGVVFPASPTD